MDLTIYDLKNIKKNCENLTTVIDNVIKAKYPTNSDKPFNSLSDYENSVKDNLTRPELYYKVQIYDRMTYISYRKNKLKRLKRAALYLFIYFIFFITFTGFDGLY